MAKTYIDTVKYIVHANLEIGGMVEKPDVVGALFGQTEGLLGDELDLRELQKNGRIGRIEVELQPRAGKSTGRIMLPSSLDMVETSILAAALETVDRVGPYDAKVGVEKIEDTRNVKRKAVVERAKSLLKSMLDTEIPESREISEMVRQEVKVAEIGEYGIEKLPCGPAVKTGDAVIVVEGRADVLNLLKNSMNNAIAIGGANVPKTLAALCREKEVTVFLDGDRGGDIILNELIQTCDIDFVARAPSGKEVEELARKEIIKCLRGRVPIEEAMASAGIRRQEGPQPTSSATGSYQGGSTAQYRQPSSAQSQSGQSGGFRRYDRRYSAPSEQRAAPTFVAPSVQGAQAEMAGGAAPAQAVRAEMPAERPVARPSTPAPTPDPSLYASLSELENTQRGRFYDSANGLKGEVMVRDILRSLEGSEGVHAVVFDGVVTQRLLDLAVGKGAKIIIGVKVGGIYRRPDGVFIGGKEASVASG